MDKSHNSLAGHQHQCLGHMSEGILDIIALAKLTAEWCHLSDLPPPTSSGVQVKQNCLAEFSQPTELQKIIKHHCVIILGHQIWFIIKQ